VTAAQQAALAELAAKDAAAEVALSKSSAGRLASLQALSKAAKGVQGGDSDDEYGDMQEDDFGL
jgi:hypothetical protein